MTIKAHTVTYLRHASAKRDGADGVLCLHKWPTGYQELIFASRKAAQDFEDRENGIRVVLKKAKR